MVWMILIILVLLVIGVLAFGLSAYNGLVKMRNRIQESWRQIDVELNRRYELIPNLVETVRGFAAHERNTLEDVTRLRNQAAQVAQNEGATPSVQRAQTEEALSGAVRNLLVSVEAYPELKSNANFLHLQKELTETEDRIAAGRRYYNANVREYNTKIESVPTNLIANMGNFQKATYFEIQDAARQSPDVNFGSISYRGEEKQAPPQVDQPTQQPALGQQQPQPYGQPAQQPQQPQQSSYESPTAQIPAQGEGQSTQQAPAQEQYGQQSYGEPQQYGEQGQYGQPQQYGEQGQYGQPQQYGQQGNYGQQ